MILSIPKDLFDNFTSPQILLCQTDKTVIGELPAYSISLDGKWNTYSEMSLTIDRHYVDVMTGETKVHPLFDKAEGLRKVFVQDVGYFVIQDPDDVYSDTETKTLSLFSSEYETGQKYLENFYINTGNENSKEVIYHTDMLGEDYFSKDSLYKLATEWDEFERYYVKEYNSDATYVYMPTTVVDENDFNTFEEVLYVKSFPNVRFYWPSKPELSLLHLVFKRIPEWTIKHVDVSLRNQERKFEEQLISVYDFLQNKVEDTFKCVIEWDTIHNEVSFYEEADDGMEDDNSVATRWDTDVFISRENLANEINVKYSSDNIKTKLRVSGGDGMSVGEVNLGQDYIINLNYYHTVDWMGRDLYLRYHDYMKLVDENVVKYEEAVRLRQGAYNLWQDMYYNVPVDTGILLVGDKFTQLYCIYDTVNALTKWLDIYGVKKDTKATYSDNVLFTLRDDNGNSATIRVYFNEETNTYRIKRTVVNEATGGSVPVYYSLQEWVNNELTDTKVGLSGYTIQSIGTLGAYLCLTIDESDPNDPTMQEYGVMLLKEKQRIYTQIFIAQTEKFMSHDDAVCVAGDSQPNGELAHGTRWLDTSDQDMIVLKEYNKASDNWNIVEIASTDVPYGSDWENGVRWLDTDGSAESDEPIIYVYDATTKSWMLSDDNTSDTVKASDYTVYLENFSKLTAIENLLDEKEKLAEFYSDGVVVQGRYITTPTKQLLKNAAKQYFGSEPIDYPSSFDSYDDTIGLYMFTITGDNNKYCVYLKTGIPYIAYSTSTAVWQLRMNKYKEISNMETFFTEDEWMKLSPFIREDEFSDSNFALTGYESEEERTDICKQLLNNAQKELKTLSQPSIEFSMTMANILAIPEFSSVKDKFKLGSFIRVGIRPDYIKRSRLLAVHINFNDISDFSADFGNLITTKSEIDKHAELLSQAIQAGKTVATNASSWQRAVDKTSELDNAIADGLKDAAISIGSANGQSIIWDQYGIHCRKLVDGTTDQYEKQQLAIINNKIVFTNNNWETSEAALGEFSVVIDGNEQTLYGLLAKAVVSGYIKGSIIEGGSLKIGDGSKNYFEVLEDGSVTIYEAGREKYATTDAVDAISKSRSFSVELIYSGSTIFSEPNSECVITCVVYNLDEDVTQNILDIGGTFSWVRTSANANDDGWNASHANRTTNTITITNTDVAKNAQFKCEVNFDPDKLNKEGT